MTAPRAEGTALDRAMEALEKEVKRVVTTWDRNSHDLAFVTADHGKVILAALRLRDADIAAAVSAENEAFYDMVQREDSRSLAGVSAHDPLRRLMDAIRARREGGSDAAASD